MECVLRGLRAQNVGVKMKKLIKIFSNAEETDLVSDTKGGLRRLYEIIQVREASIDSKLNVNINNLIRAENLHVSKIPIYVLWFYRFVKHGR